MNSITQEIWNEGYEQGRKETVITLSESGLFHIFSIILWWKNSHKPHNRPQIKLRDPGEE